MIITVQEPTSVLTRYGYPTLGADREPARGVIALYCTIKFYSAAAVCESKDGLRVIGKEQEGRKYLVQ